MRERERERDHTIRHDNGKLQNSGGLCKNDIKNNYVQVMCTIDSFTVTTCQVSGLRMNSVTSHDEDKAQAVLGETHDVSVCGETRGPLQGKSGQEQDDKQDCPGLASPGEPLALYSVLPCKHRKSPFLWEANGLLGMSDLDPGLAVQRSC